jgi:hypothetical protein
MPKHFAQRYHTLGCRHDHFLYTDREKKRKARKSSSLRGVNFGALIDLFEKEGPIVFKVKDRTFVFKEEVRSA